MNKAGLIPEMVVTAGSRYTHHLHEGKMGDTVSH